jgi:hypothetical protein
LTSSRRSIRACARARCSVCALASAPARRSGWRCRVGTSACWCWSRPTGASRMECRWPRAAGWVGAPCDWWTTAGWPRPSSTAQPSGRCGSARTRVHASARGLGSGCARSLARSGGRLSAHAHRRAAVRPAGRPGAPAAPIPDWRGSERRKLHRLRRGNPERPRAARRNGPDLPRLCRGAVLRRRDRQRVRSTNNRRMASSAGRADCRTSPGPLDGPARVKRWLCVRRPSNLQRVRRV